MVKRNQLKVLQVQLGMLRPSIDCLKYLLAQCPESTNLSQPDSDLVLMLEKVVPQFSTAYDVLVERLAAKASLKVTEWDALTVERQGLAALMTGLDAIGQQTRLVIEFEQLAWFRQLQALSKRTPAALLNWLHYPIQFTLIEENRYYQLILQQFEQLTAVGWPELSLIAYLNQLNQQFEQQNFEQVRPKIKRLAFDSRRIGSHVFKLLWQAWQVEDQKSAQLKLAVFLKLVELLDQLENQPEPIEKMLANFDVSLAPHDALWRELAQTVQLAFPAPQPLNGDLGRRVHQLRYVISAQQAQYIRVNFKGETDQIKLAQYLSQQNYDLTASDRLHQKKTRQSNGYFPNGYGWGNFKVLLAFHTEFILNSTGEFQNEIDPTGTNPNGVINGASFNYATKSDDTHQRLDVKFGDFDPVWRKAAIFNQGNRFLAPVKGRQNMDGYKNSYGRYSIQGHSAFYRSQRLKIRFKCQTTLFKFYPW